MRAWLRFRVFVGGKLAAEDRLYDSDDWGAAARRHSDICRAADDLGQPWLIEIFNPQAPPNQAFVRWGTDTGGMVMPHGLPLSRAVDTWAEAVSALLEGRPRGA